MEDSDFEDDIPTCRILPPNMKDRFINMYHAVFRDTDNDDEEDDAGSSDGAYDNNDNNNNEDDRNGDQHNHLQNEHHDQQDVGDNDDNRNNDNDDNYRANCLLDDEHNKILYDKIMISLKINQINEKRSFLNKSVSSALHWHKINFVGATKIIKKHQRDIRNRTYIKCMINHLQTYIRDLDGVINARRNLYRDCKLKMQKTMGVATPLSIMYNEMKKCNICYSVLRGKNFCNYDNCVHSHCMKCIFNIITCSDQSEKKCPECNTNWKVAFKLYRQGSNFLIQPWEFNY